MENFIMRNLYDASIKGCVSTLKTLLQRDPLILNRTSLYPFSETPLHNASLLGHLELCQFLLGINPNLASEVNSEGHCSLHLASAKGHTEIVKTLLLTDSETCLIRDKDDKVPLYFAVMRGRVGVIKELISAMPETEIIRVMSESDDHSSILHLCVLYNHLEALKILVESVRGDIDQFLCSKDKEGHTILDLAVKRGQIKIIKYLLSLSEKSESINTSKTDALRALHMLEHCPRDFISHTNEHILTEQEAQTSTNIVIAQQSLSLTPRFTSQQNHVTPPNNDPPQPPQSLPRNNPLQQAQPSFIHPLEITNPSPRNDPSHPQPSSHDPSPTIDPSNPPSQFSPTPSITNEQHNNRWDRFENFCNTYLINQGYWIDKKTKEQLMVAATVIATMTFQSVISPPGGVWQEDTTKGGYACPDYGFCEAGTAVVGYVWSPDFLNFIFFNSASFFASLCVLLVLVSGFPLQNRVIVWLLAVLMIVAITCMLLTYMWALGLVSPNHIFYRIRDLGYILVGIWSFLLFVVCFIQIIRIVFWIRSRGRDSTNVAL